MRERYRRHQMIDWFSQERVQGTRVAVIGAGATGNEVVKNLVLLGTGALDIFDFDRVEEHNLTRSIFLRDEDVGHDKAARVALRAAEVDASVRVRAICGDFWDTLALARLARYDGVVACVDNVEARLRLNRLCRIAGTDLINAAIDSRYASVELFPLSQPAAACYQCCLPDTAYQRVAERYSCGGLRRRAWRERKVPTTAITASLAGALAASLALRLDTEKRAGAFRIFCDSRVGTSTRTALARRTDCPGCSEFAALPARVPGGDDWWRALAEAVPGDVQSLVVRLSDPVVVGYRCARCGNDGGPMAPRLRRARDLDEGVCRCARCADVSMQVDIRDRFTAAELRAHFGQRPLPVKFLLAEAGDRLLCIDMEQSENDD